jgi:hypothetical protein
MYDFWKLGGRGKFEGIVNNRMLLYKILDNSLGHSSNFTEYIDGLNKASTKVQPQRLGLRK